MSVILILIFASLGLALTFLVSFIWAVRAGQFEDTCTPSMRVLIDSESSGPAASGNPLLINTSLQRGEQAPSERTNRGTGFQEQVQDALTTRETAEAVPVREVAQVTPLKRGVNKNTE